MHVNGGGSLGEHAQGHLGTLKSKVYMLGLNSLA